MKKSLLVALLGLVMVLSGCISHPPQVNKIAKSAPLELRHMVYIPIHADQVNGQTGALLNDINAWIENHPNKKVVSVAMVNATQEDYVGGYSHTSISGALIVFEPK
jgi:hypothetical protein